MTSEARRDLLGAAGLLVLAVLYLVANRRYPIDTLTAPGPGVFPLAVGLLVIGLALRQVMGALRARRSAAPIASSRLGAPARWRLATALGLIVAWPAVIPLIGFLPASFIVVVMSSRLLGARGWRPLALALGVTIVVDVLFAGWLGVPLPRAAR